MYCTACGAQIADRSRFCKNCGEPQQGRSRGEASDIASGDGRLSFHPPSRKRSGGNHFWLWAIVVPIVVLAVLITMIGAMRPSQDTRVVQFTSPRQIAFSGDGPEVAKVGVPIEFTYEIANTGTADFKDFRIAFPEAMEKSFEVSSSRPSGAIVSESGKRMVALGFLGAGKKATYTVVLTPKVEGESGVTATFYDGTGVLTDDRSKGMVYKKVKVSP